MIVPSLFSVEVLLDLVQEVKWFEKILTFKTIKTSKLIEPVDLVLLHSFAQKDFCLSAMNIVGFAVGALMLVIRTHYCMSGRLIFLNNSDGEVAMSKSWSCL